jgi:hypothetical protein
MKRSQQPCVINSNSSFNSFTPSTQSPSMETTSIPTTSILTTSIPTTSVPTIYSIPTTSIPATSIQSTSLKELPTKILPTSNFQHAVLLHPRHPRAPRHRPGRCHQSQSSAGASWLLFKWSWIPMVRRQGLQARCKENCGQDLQCEWCLWLVRTWPEEDSLRAGI